MFDPKTYTWGAFKQQFVTESAVRGVEDDPHAEVVPGVTYLEMLSIPEDQLFTDRTVPDDTLPDDIDDEDIASDKKIEETN